jgi:hypothetical protein
MARQPPFHTNLTYVVPTARPTPYIGANTTAVDISNAASAANQAGRHNEATKMHKEALQIKVRAYGEASIQVALIHNNLG